MPKNIWDGYSFPLLDLARLRDTLTSLPNETYYNINRDTILPERPSMFQVDPLVRGEPEFARTAKRIIDMDPRIKAVLSGINQGPTRGSMETMMDSGLPIDKFSGTNLMGIEGPVSGTLDPRVEIGINPELGPELKLKTLIHEIGHVGGMDEATTRKHADTYNTTAKFPNIKTWRK